MEVTLEQALQQAVASHKAGKLQNAERLYRAILQSRPLHPDANHNLGVLAMRSNRIEVALSLFKTALEANPNIEQFWLSYIEALITGNQLDLAKKVLKHGTQSKLSEAAAQFFDAEIHHNRGNLNEAKVGYAKVIALKSDNVQAYNNLGLILQKLGNADEAEQSFRQAIALKSDFAQAHFNLGNMHKERGRLKEAEESYRQAIRATTGFTAAHRNLASTLRELGEVEQAIESEKYVKFLNSSNVVSNEVKQLSGNLSFIHPSPMEYPMHYRAGMGTENVGGFLRAMAQMLRPKNILEIGAGYTTPFLLEALVNNEKVYDDGNLEPS